MKTRTEPEMRALQEHKHLIDTARYFAMSMLEGPLVQSKIPAEIIDCAFTLARRFSERVDKEWTITRNKHCPPQASLATVTEGAADPVQPGAFKTAGDKKIWVGPTLSGDLSGSEPPRVPKLDALRDYSTENGARLRELAQRLVASGPKAAHVSASETHEISDGLINLLDMVEGVNRAT